MASHRHTNYFVHTLLRARGWQHRPEFDELCAWWRGNVAFRSAKDAQSGATFAERKATIGRGVCALVGMAGAGKTAIPDRFLNELLDNTSTTRQRVSPPLPSPSSVFVYSFYDDDKPENFFRHLQIWLEGTSAPDKQKSATQLMFDIQQHQGLIVLDGLEKVQESGARGGFGRLTSPSLRDLLNHIARVQLAPIVEHCGRHALTVDLAGGYIKEYGHGDPSTPLNWARPKSCKPT